MRLALLLPLLVASSLAPASAQELSRLESDALRSLENGKGQLYAYLLRTPQAELGSGLTARIVHALIAAGANPTSTEFAAILKRIAATPTPEDPEATIQRVEALVAAGPKAWKRAIEQNLLLLYEQQTETGGFLSNRPSKDRERPDAATLTARAVLAFRAASLAGFDIPAERLERAARFLLHCGQRDGGVVHRTGRRSRSSGRPTAAALAAWIWLRTVPALEAMYPDLDRAIDRAERWLMREWAVDKNPGNAGEQLFPYLVELERATQLLLLAPPEEKRRSQRIDGFLVSYELPTHGWNHRASLQDLSPPIVQTPGGGVAAGVPLVRLELDAADTAEALLALADATRPSPSELRYALARRMTEPRRLPPRERFESFVALLHQSRETAIPSLIGYLRAPEHLVRTYAIRALHALTGKEFGYKAASSPERNLEAIRQWQAWWLENG